MVVKTSTNKEKCLIPAKNLIKTCKLKFVMSNIMVTYVHYNYSATCTIN